MQPINIHEDVLVLKELENVQLSFLIYYDEAAHTYFIKSLDFSVDSEGRTLEECKANIQEAILIHLEDCAEGTNIFDPAEKIYWDLFVDLKIQNEQKYIPHISFPIRFPEPKRVLKYA
jgi:predicted RNase H-like HicB family nuclease